MKNLISIFVLLIITGLVSSACDTSEVMLEEVSCENPIISERPQSCETCDVLKSTIVDKSLQAYYPFDTDARDYSGNCRHGELIGSPGLVDGVSGKALQFDGIEDFIVIPDSLSPLPATLSTIVFWLKVEESLDSFDGTIMQWVYEAEYSTKTRFRVSRKSLSSCVSCPAFTFDDSGAGIPRVFPRDWILIVIRQELGEQRGFLRIDPANIDPGGRTRYQASTLEGKIQGQKEIIIASEDSISASLPRRFKGAIDELRIYNRILSTAEIDELLDL